MFTSSPLAARLVLSAIALTLTVVARSSLGQCISLTTVGVHYTQNFDTLINVAGSTTNDLTIPGWFITESGGGARDNEQYAVDTGFSITGDTYSYGIAGSSERALGGLQSGTLIPTFGACFTNATGQTVVSLDIAYTGEEWRLGVASRTDRLDFQYSTDATSLTSGTWTDVDALDFITPDTSVTGPKDGNQASARTALSATIASLAIASGAEFWVRYNDFNVGGNDDGLAVDDFSLIPQWDVSGTATLNINDVNLAEGDPPGTTPFIFAVTLTTPAGPGGVSFDIATADGSAQDDNPGTEDNDYVAKALTGQSIPPDSSGPYFFTVSVNRDTTVEPDETFFVNVTNIVGATAGDTQGMGTIRNDDVALTPIHDIQGPGPSSPLSGMVVTTRGVVTGVKYNGFFIQEPDASTDADPATSEGVFVYTSSTPPPSAAVGNWVQVTGTIAEYIPAADPLSPPLTELISPTVVQLATGNPLPAPIPLSNTFPDPAGPYDQLERLEGMRVSVTSLTVVGPTQGRVDEPQATATSTGVFYGVYTGLPRPFREAGIPAPDPPPVGGGTIPPIPRFDANPEILRVDSDGLGGALIDVGAGAVVTNLVGPLDYDQRSYTLLPDPNAGLGVSGGPVATAVSPATTMEFTVATFNVQRFFDTVNDPTHADEILTPPAFTQRLAKASLTIRDFLGMPDIIGVQEVENLTTLAALATRISTDALTNGQPDPLYVPYLLEGTDPSGIDVGYLVKTAPVIAAIPRVEVVAAQQELSATPFVNPDSSFELLNDRPPLRLDILIHHANGASFPVTLINNHLHTLNGANSEQPGTQGWPTQGARVRAKRQAQATDLANLAQGMQTADPTRRIVLLGDFNAYELNDGLGHLMGVIAGTPVPDNETAVPGDGVDLVNPDLDNLFDAAVMPERYGFIYGGNALNLDHLLANAALISSTLAQRLEHARLNADFPEIARNNHTPLRLSDHDPVVAYFEVEGFALADLSITKTAGADPITAGTNLTYTITVTNEGPDAATNAAWSDTLPVGTNFESLVFPGDWTCTTPPVGSGGTVNCIVASLPVGNYAFNLTVSIDPTVAAGTTLANTVAVTTNTSDGDTDDASATATTTVAASADLTVTKVDTPDPVTDGSALTYTISVINAGPSNAAAVTLTDPLPAGTTFVSLSVPGGWSCTTPSVGSGGTVSCTVASLPIGNSTFSLTVMIAAGTLPGALIDNTASLSSSTDPDTTNNTAHASTTVSSSTGLAGTLSVSGNYVRAGLVTYTLTLTNNGPAMQQDNPGDEMFDVLPAELILQSATATSGTVIANVGLNTITWNGSIGITPPVLNRVTITIKAQVSPQVTPNTTISNQAALSFDTDGNGTNETAVVSDDPVQPGSADATDFIVLADPVPIPTLGQLALLMMAMMLVLMAVAKVRKPTS